MHESGDRWKRLIIALVVIMTLIGIANLSHLLKGNKQPASAATMAMRPAAPNAQQVHIFEMQQQLQAERDAQERQHQQEITAAMQQLEAAEGIPGHWSARHSTTGRSHTC
jgi:Tfp pilus assembly protein FimT